MKISGSSRKDGITFYGENYAVSVQYDKKKDSYSYELYERRTEKAVQNVPVLRGLESLWNNQGVRGMLVLSAAEAVGWMFSKSRSRYVRALGKGIIGAQYGLVAVLMYRIFGWDGEVRRFHGAEHKAIGAYEKRQGRISVQEAEEVSSNFPPLRNQFSGICGGDRDSDRYIAVGAWHVSAGSYDGCSV